MSPRYCSECGKLLPPWPEGRSGLECPACGVTHYRNSKPTANALVVREGKVLLVRRAVAPHAGEWDVPGGFLESGEPPEDGARREVREETGLDIALDELLGVYIDVYPYGQPDEHTLNFFYLAHVLGGEPAPADDAAELGWFEPEALPADIAFHCCRQVLEDWRARRAAKPDEESGTK